jgi:hypothetical protein
MARKTVDDVIADLESLVRVWKGKVDFKVGDIDTLKLETTISSLRTKSTGLEDAKTLVTRLVNEVNTALAEALQIQTRGLSGVRAGFGPDSSEYEQAGGIRASERKKPVAKKKA